MSSHPATGSRHFHDQLEHLTQHLLEMSHQAEASIHLAVDAFLQRDEAKADAVLTREHYLNALELEIEQLAISLLALQQPMARDLRFVISVIKISSDLERVGDHAVNIAQSTLRVVQEKAVIVSHPEIEDMARSARGMLGDALDAFVRADGPLGRDVCLRDDAVDAIYGSFFRKLITRMREDPSTITVALEFLLVSRNIERVADLATNIAEDAVYLAEGRSIKHGGTGAT
ncbi:MAG TPA: phosphate signaling complex protein PhoU [Gemmatimonadaceae bacterium]